MLGFHHRGILKKALANGGVYHPTNRSHYRSLGTLRELGYFEKVDGQNSTRDLWVLTRTGARIAGDLTDIDAKKEKV